MKKSIFKKFVLMILLALLVSSTVFSLVMSRRILGQTEEKLADTLRLMDYILDYEGDVESQIESLCAIDGNENSRATVLRADGQVLADSGVVETIWTGKRSARHWKRARALPHGIQRHFTSRCFMPP